MSGGRTAVVAGATGLVGSLLWPLLAERKDIWSRILLLTRRPLRSLPDHVHCVVADFGDLAATLAAVKADDYFCCLGTTIKAAGSQAAFRRVDHDYVVEIGRLLRRNGLQQVLMVSAVGATPDSSIFYNRVKGEAERDLSALGVAATTFMRPSLLLGERQEQRLLESLAIGALGWSAPLWRGALSRYRPVEARSVARAMCHVAVEVAIDGPRENPRTVDSAAIQALSEQYVASVSL